MLTSSKKQTYIQLETEHSTLLMLEMRQQDGRTALHVS